MGFHMEDDCNFQVPNLLEIYRLQVQGFRIDKILITFHRLSFLNTLHGLTAHKRAHDS